MNIDLSNINEINTEVLEEIIKCKKNPIYFIETYTKILHPKYGIITPKLYPKQKELILSILNYPFHIILKSRQIGISTTIALISCWMLIFHSNFRIGVISRSREEAIDLGERIERAILSVPKIFWIDFVENNKLNKKLKNNSEIIISAPIKHALRGETLNFVILDEVLAMNQIEYIYSSVFYTITHNFVNISSAERKNRDLPSGLILISTGAIIDYLHPASCRGAIWFFEKWKESLSDAGEIKFKPFKIHWRDTKFFDEEWYKKQCEILSNNPDLIATELECQFIEKNANIETKTKLEKIKNISFKNIQIEDIPYSKLKESLKNENA